MTWFRARAAIAALSAAAALLAARSASADEDPPAMDPDRPVGCFTDGKGVRWRVQCTEPGATDSAPRRCILAIDGELDQRGGVVRSLERAGVCVPVARFDPAEWRAKGYEVVSGAADVDRGWMRDHRGRPFQVTFDLHRRLYAGVSWTPTLRRAGGADGEAARAALDFGLLEAEGTTGSEVSGWRHRLRLVEGMVELAPFAADATLLRYDLSRRRAEPLFRITTFFGRPRRYDIDAHLGAWFELGHVQSGEVAQDRTETLWRYGSAHLTWDLWRTREMDSFVRLRSGLGYERATEDGRPDRDAVTWTAAAEGDLTIGRSGLNRLGFVTQLERPSYVDRSPTERRHARRALARVGYERVLVAVNDQPVTARVGAEAEYRDDVPDAPTGWDLRALAGLRFNLWTPPR